MNEFDHLFSYLPKGAFTLLLVAIAIGALFIGLLAFDLARRWRSENRFRDHTGGWRHGLRRQFRRVGEFRHAMQELRRQRAHRRRWDEPERRPRKPK